MERAGNGEELRSEVERFLEGGTGPDFARPGFAGSPAEVIGGQLGHYEIVAKLGQGGMGEVYRARDGRLGREVALKVLPESLAQDEDRLRRFEREARVLASLNHPHIAQVHGFDEDEGRHYLVMELAEGETLSERIARGPLPSDEAVEIAVQIAEALEAAHERGIVHRDLKPANVNVAGTAGGYRVKVLDFGLAKTLEPPAEADADLTQSPTLTQQTAAGVLLGTAAYMSPEQVRGQEADARSDIWAFGCVLYEMLAGNVAFTGQNVSDVVAAVLKDEPEWESLPEIPWHVRGVLERCLSRDRRLRYQHVGDMRIDLEDPIGLRFGPASVAPRGLDSSRPRTVVLCLALAAVATTVGFWAWNSKPDGRVKNSVTRFTLEHPVVGSSWMRLALSRDGRQLAFARAEDGVQRIFVRDFTTGVSRPIVGSEGGERPFFSPDGRQVGFYSYESSGLYRAPIGGGEPVLIARTEQLAGATWADSGLVYFSRLFRKLCGQRARGRGVVRRGESRWHSEISLDFGSLERLA